MKVSYAIRTGEHWYVKGFSKAWGIVEMQRCKFSYGMKKFKSKAGAQRFIDTYADKGYGLNSKDCNIVRVPSGNREDMAFI